MISRRNLFKYTLGAGAGLFLASKVDLNGAFAESPDAPVFARLAARLERMAGAMLDPIAIPKYATPLLIPPQMPRAGFLHSGGKWIDYYEISVRQFKQQILPARLAEDHRLGLWAGQGAQFKSADDLQRAVIDHRGELEPPSADQVDQ